MLDFTPEKLDLARKYLENVEVVIVGEMSLVSSDNLYNLHKRLQEIFASEESFGGRCILLVGDILQLPPIRAPQIFSAPRQFDSAVMFKSRELNWFITAYPRRLNNPFESVILLSCETRVYVEELNV